MRVAPCRRFQFGAAEMVCYDTPGHTRGHVTYHFPAAKALFPGKRSTCRCVGTKAAHGTSRSNSSRCPFGFSAAGGCACSGQAHF